jgi:hypothetical protein
VGFRYLGRKDGAGVEMRAGGVLSPCVLQDAVDALTMGPLLSAQANKYLLPITYQRERRTATLPLAVAAADKDQAAQQVMAYLTAEDPLFSAAFRDGWRVRISLAEQG